MTPFPSISLSLKMYFSVESSPLYTKTPNDEKSILPAAVQTLWFSKASLRQMNVFRS
jgi:hypothetical protein